MTLLNSEGLLEQRAEIINLFTEGRTASARELTKQELHELCAVLNKNALQLDKKRKRVIAVIFGMLEKMNRKVTIDYVKGMACRAAGEKDFNSITSTRLDSLYNAFLHRQKDLTFTGRLADCFISESQSYN